MKEILKNIELNQIIGLYHFEDSCFTVGKILKINEKYLYLLSYDVNFKEDGIKIFLINSVKRIILKSNYIENLKKIQSNTYNFNNGDKDLFQKLIINKIKTSIYLADESVENAYLIEKEKNYFRFQILDDNGNILSEEIIEKGYLKRIRIANPIKREEYKDFKIITTIDDREYMAYDLFYNKDYLIFYEKEEFFDIGKINIIAKNSIENISELKVKLKVKKESFCDLIDFEKELEIFKILKICLENNFLVFIDNKDFLETKIGIIVELKEEKLRIKEVDKYGNYNKISEIYLDEIELLAVKNYKFWEENYEEKF